MRIPNKVIELTSHFNRKWDLKRSACELRSILEEMDSDWEHCTITSLDIVDDPCGSLQNGDEYVDQSTGYCSDDYHGVYYYPIEDSNSYLAIGYRC